MRCVLLTLCGLLLAVLAGSPSDTVRANGPSFVVIAHPSLQFSEMRANELKNIFLRRAGTLRGNDLVPLNYPKNLPLRLNFDQVVLQMSPEEVGRYWVDFRIRGGGHPPRTISTPELMVRVVAELRNSIGYVPASLANSPHVKIVLVRGITSP